jgi:hypothetical protein
MWRVAESPRDEAFWEEVRERVTTLLRDEDERLVLRPGTVRIDRADQTVRVSAAAARLENVAAYLTHLSIRDPLEEERP